MDHGRWDASSSDSSVYELDDETIPEGIPQTLRSEYIPGTTIYPIKLRDCGSTYKKVLYDVEGRALTSLDGSTKLNVYTRAMKDALDYGEIRAIHNMSEPTYWYFVTSISQLKRFRTHREFGSARKCIYHVYVDEDVDRTTHRYNKLFISKRKLKTPALLKEDDTPSDNNTNTTATATAVAT